MVPGQQGSMICWPCCRPPPDARSPWSRQSGSVRRRTWRSAGSATRPPTFGTRQAAGRLQPLPVRAARCSGLTPLCSTSGLTAAACARSCCSCAPSASACLPPTRRQQQWREEAPAGSSFAPRSVARPTRWGAPEPPPAAGRLCRGCAGWGLGHPAGSLAASRAMARPYWIICTPVRQ